jgi:hypothetical protein
MIKSLEKGLEQPNQLTKKSCDRAYLRQKEFAIKYVFEGKINCQKKVNPLRAQDGDSLALCNMHYFHRFTIT